MCVFCMVNFHYPPAWTLIYKKLKKTYTYSGVRFINTSSTDKRYSRQSQKVEDSMVLKYDIKH